MSSKKETKKDLVNSPRDRIDYIIDIFYLGTDRGLAEAVGVSRNTIKGVRQRNRIGPNTARKIAESLKLSYSWVKNGHGAPPMAQKGSPEPFSVQPDAFIDTGRDLFADEARAMARSPRKRLFWMQERLDLGDLAALATACGLDVEQVQDILATDEIDEARAAVIAGATGYAYEWILEGKGPPTKKGAEIEGLKDFGRSATPAFPQAAAGPGQNFVMVPKAADELSAGGGVIPQEGTREAYAFRLDWLKRVATSPRNVILFDVDGDSMYPLLQDKDTVLIDTGRLQIRDGRVYAIGIGGAILIKRLSVLPGPKIKIESVNRDYHTSEADPDDIRIIGQMIWFGRTVV